jgi:RNA ligase
MIKKYTQFIKENTKISGDIPSYEEAVKITKLPESPFYEIKKHVEGFNISLFNYRFALNSDFNIPGAKEMRGLCFVFNKDGSLHKRFILLEKFFNLNQTTETMYSVIKNYKIKFINNKEDGSIASFIKLPNNEIVGRTKMGFDNDQAYGINRIYNTNKDVKEFVDWCLKSEIIPIFEYVSPFNRIVLKYSDEELILLRLRDNKTGEYLDLKKYLDRIKTIKIADFEDNIKDLDHLIELTAKQTDKEGSVVTAIDDKGKDFFFKIKTPWYMERRGLLTNDINRENVIIGYILDDKIDDVLSTIPEDEREVRDKILKITSTVKEAVSKKIKEVETAYDEFIKSGMSKKDYALNKKVGNPNFYFVMSIIKFNELKNLSKEEISKFGDRYYGILKSLETEEMVKEYIRKKTQRLFDARNWLNLN